MLRNHRECNCHPWQQISLYLQPGIPKSKSPNSSLFLMLSTWPWLFYWWSCKSNSTGDTITNNVCAKIWEQSSTFRDILPTPFVQQAVGRRQWAVLTWNHTIPWSFGHGEYKYDFKNLQVNAAWKRLSNNFIQLITFSIDSWWCHLQYGLMLYLSFSQLMLTWWGQTFCIVGSLTSITCGFPAQRAKNTELLLFLC